MLYNQLWPTLSSLSIIDYKINCTHKPSTGIPTKLYQNCPSHRQLFLTEDTTHETTYDTRHDTNYNKYVYGMGWPEMMSDKDIFNDGFK